MRTVRERDHQSAWNSSNFKALGTFSETGTR
jgi:hypothetical protein